jgi:hypothetical protein
MELRVLLVEARLGEAERKHTIGIRVSRIGAWTGTISGRPRSGSRSRPSSARALTEGFTRRWLASVARVLILLAIALCRTAIVSVVAISILVIIILLRSAVALRSRTSWSGRCGARASGASVRALLRAVTGMISHGDGSIRCLSTRRAVVEN